MPDILYKDTHILVVLKSPGLLSEGEAKDSLPQLLREHLQESGEKSDIYTVHRLDRETGGIMVYARTKKAAAKLSLDITEGRWKKIYTALLWGRPEQDSGTLCDLLYYDRQRSKSFVVKNARKGVKEAILCYSVISSPTPETTAVRIELETGRTHQIRVQFASRKMPLCGDRRYGAPAESGKNLALCATELSFFHPITDQPLCFKTAPTSFSL